MNKANARQTTYWLISLASSPSFGVSLLEVEAEPVEDSAVASSELVDLMPAPPQPTRKVIVRNTLKIIRNELADITPPLLDCR